MSYSRVGYRVSRRSLCTGTARVSDRSPDWTISPEGLVSRGEHACLHGPRHMITRQKRSAPSGGGSRSDDRGNIPRQRGCRARTTARTNVLRRDWQVLEGVHRCGDDALNHGTERSRQLVVDPHAVPAGGHETPPAQIRQMAGYGRLRESQTVMDVTDAHFNRPERSGRLAPANFKHAQAAMNEVRAAYGAAHPSASVTA
jgi:hypothetical protein